MPARLCLDDPGTAQRAGPTNSNYKFEFGAEDETVADAAGIRVDPGAVATRRAR
jgi:hypothetical protein